MVAQKTLVKHHHFTPAWPAWPDLRQVMQLDLEVQRDVSLLGSAALQWISFPENEPETERGHKIPVNQL